MKSSKKAICIGVRIDEDLIDHVEKKIYQCNPVISVESFPKDFHPVVVKQSAKRYPARRSLRSVEKGIRNDPIPCRSRGCPQDVACGFA